MTWFRPLYRQLGLLLPPLCTVCEHQLPFQAGPEICGDCQTSLKTSSSLPGDSTSKQPVRCQCHKCGAWIAYELLPGECCRHCDHLSLPFHQVTGLGNYQDEMRKAVIRIKHRGQDALTIQLGRWLGIAIADAKHPVDLIIPVPSHWTRKWWRGCDVAGMLAEGIQQELGCPINDDSLICCRRTQKQGLLSTRERFFNVKGCFRVAIPKKIAGKHILLVDDVMTSCATATQAAHQLLQAGANTLSLAIVARGVGMA